MATLTWTKFTTPDYPHKRPAYRTTPSDRFECRPIGTKTFDLFDYVANVLVHKGSLASCKAAAENVLVKEAATEPTPVAPVVETPKPEKELAEGSRPVEPNPPGGFAVLTDHLLAKPEPMPAAESRTKAPAEPKPTKGKGKKKPAKEKELRGGTNPEPVAPPAATETPKATPEQIAEATFTLVKDKGSNFRNHPDYAEVLPRYGLLPEEVTDRVWERACERYTEFAKREAEKVIGERPKAGTVISVAALPVGTYFKSPPSKHAEPDGKVGEVLASVGDDVKVAFRNANGKVERLCISGAAEVVVITEAEAMVGGPKGPGTQKLEGSLAALDKATGKKSSTGERKPRAPRGSGDGGKLAAQLLAVLTKTPMQPKDIKVAAKLDKTVMIFSKLKALMGQGKIAGGPDKGGYYLV